MRDADRYRRVQDFFLRVREIESVEEREAALADLSPDLDQEVRALLVADACQDDFLEPASCRESDRSSSASIAATECAREPEVATELPRWIDRYRLLQRIGEGGHGTVYMAQQATPMERMVAVKLVKQGMDSRQVLARFHAEQQALALMDHPSIAKVFDAGTTPSGGPYFVMELVKGIPVTEFCETNQLDLADRLRLFVQVCQAVHHAHQKGVIHRDLKPSNILVTMSDGGPLAKVIDFGIAKALETRLTDRTLFTEFGQMIGTLEYMSPEQAEMSAVDVDTRSDVYSLGVLLYELLTGTPPITRDQLLRDGLWEISHRLRETEPMRPSNRITESRQQPSQVSHGGSRRARGVPQLPNRDLDWITMMALEKDRRRRYDSARDLGRDVDRFLDGQPISARPPTWSYVLGKTVRRHKLLCSVVALTTVAVIVALAGLMWGVQAARRQATLANMMRAEAELQAQRAMQERERADESARRLAETVYSELVESSWEAVRGGNGERAHALLESCPPDLRQWEWKFVEHRVASLAEQTLRKSGGSAIEAVHLDRRAKRSACVLENGQVEVWDVRQRQLVRTLTFSALADTAIFSPNDLVLYVGLRNGHLLSLDTTDWRQLKDQSLQRGAIYHAVCSRDGECLAVCTGSGWIGVLQPTTGNIVDAWKPGTRMGYVTWDHAAERLVGAGLNGELYVFQRGKAAYEQQSVSESNLGALVWLDRGHLAVLAGRTAVAVSWAGKLDETRELARLDGSATAAAVPGASGELFVGCSDGKLWRVDGSGSGDAVLVQEYPAAVRDVQYLDAASLPAAAREGQLLIALADGRLLLCPLSRQGNTLELTSPAGIANGIFLPRQFRVATVDAEGWLRLCDQTTGHVDREVRAHPASVWSLSASADEGQLATVGDDFHLRVWSTPTLDLMWEAKIGLGVRELAWDPQGRFVVAAPPADCQEGAIGVWDVAQQSCTRQLIGHDNWVMKLAFSTDGRTLVSTGENGTARVWNFESGECRSVLESPSGSTAIHVAIQEQRDRLYLGHRDGQVTVWELNTGELLHVWSAFGDTLSGLELTPGGHRLLVTSQSDSRLRIWDTTREALVATLDLGRGYLAAFRLSPDGHSYATVGSDGGVQVGPACRAHVATESG